MKTKTKARRMWAAREDIEGGEDETITLKKAHGKGRVSNDWVQCLLIPADKASVEELRERIMQALASRFNKASGLPSTPDKWTGEADAVLRAIGLGREKK